MKRNILHTLWAAALLLTACTQEELLLSGTNDATPLFITVTDGGYASTEKTVTRTAENDYRTNFTAGDACGLYVVRGGTVAYNVKLIAVGADGNALTWQLEAGTKLVGGFSDESYFLYYPYQADMTGKVNASATDAEGFFAPLVSGWQPKADQSTYANYTASDLMTAMGTATKGTDGTLSLSFSMTHRMAMAVIEMPPTVYKFTNTDGSIPDYIVASSADFTDGSMRPYSIVPGTYRCIVNPTNGTSASITGSYANGKKEFTVAPNGITANSYKAYKIDGGQAVEKNHNLQVGDFLLADGSLVGKDETLTTEQQAVCIGIVFHTGQHSNDQSDYTGSGIGQQKCRGYAAALQDATAPKCMWGVTGRELGCCPTDPGGNRQNNYSAPNIDWSGYNWTQKIINAASGKNKLNATKQSGYPATYYAVVDYESKVSAPAKSSGWFLPSIGQMWNIYENRTSLFDGKEVATGLKSDCYWSSSEYYRASLNFALGVRVHDGCVYNYYKDGNYGYVRPVLAF